VLKNWRTLYLVVVTESCMVGGTNDPLKTGWMQWAQFGTYVNSGEPVRWRLGSNLTLELPSNLWGMGIELPTDAMLDAADLDGALKHAQSSLAVLQERIRDGKAVRYDPTFPGN